MTGVRHRVNQDGWQTDVQFGLAAERFAERPHIVDAPAAGLYRRQRATDWRRRQI